MTPHCRSTSTGPGKVSKVTKKPSTTMIIPLGLGTLALGSSFFFFVFGAFSGSPSALRFFPLLSSIFLPAFLPPFLSSSSSLSSSSLSSALRASSSRAASLARSRASLASFLRCAFSFLTFRQAAMCALVAVFRMLFLQCLHCCRSGESSRGRPVAKASRALSSSWLTTGPGEATEAAGELTFFFFSSVLC